METGAEQVSGILCWHCKQPVSADEMNCMHCGMQQPAPVPDMDEAVKKQLQFLALTFFFGVHLIICLIANFTHYVTGLVPLFVVDGVLSLVTLFYLLLYWADLKNLLRWNSFTLGKTIVYSLTAISGAATVHYAVKWLNKTIFDSDAYYYYAFSHLAYAKLVTVLVVALQPAVFEELAFRGVLQEGLNRVTNSRQAILISAFLFSLLHMSFISFFWLMPFALWLGYVRNKENTIWYGVLIHFFFNTTACFLEFFELHLFN